ncbi:hypothetical protein AURDEDRAFT_186090 [Auricularia subglabra TFB-10046 SS5]|nr:hypothetical protein AURDEDRAFT_186090 [Auricularia subglabra TFB-10046 SS5]
MSRDPNRYAEGLEAMMLKERLIDEEYALRILRTKYERAEQSERDARQRFAAIEEQYILYKALLDEAAEHTAASKVQYETQLTSVNAKRSFLHPVRKAPLEVLGSIFQHCAGEISFSDPLPAIDGDIRLRQRQPFQLAAVCRRWRQASMAHPRAWSHVELCLDGVEGDNVTKWAVYLDTVLSRSHSAPLNVCLTRCNGSRPEQATILHKLAPAMVRCLRAQMVLLCLDMNDTLLPLLTARMPSLREAYIHFRTNDDSDVLSTTQLFPHMPMLQFLSADNVFESLYPGAAFPSLTKASLAHLPCADDADVLGGMLRAVPNLQDLLLEWPDVDYPLPNATPLTVPQVTVLTVFAEADCPVEQLLHRFTFPGVAVLSLYGKPESVTNRLQFLHAFTPKTRIDELAFSEVGGAFFQSFLDAVSALTNLEQLYVESSDITAANLLALRARLCPASPTWPCKRLRGIQFHDTCTFAEDCDASIFLEIINSRATAAVGGGADIPRKLDWLHVDGWETSSRSPIKGRLQHALTAVALFGGKVFPDEDAISSAARLLRSALRSGMPPDPNRFAQGLEATTLRNRIEDEELALDVLRAKYERAEHAAHEAQTKFREIEDQYQLHKALVNDTAAYLSRSKTTYDSQLASLATHRAFLHPVRKTPLDVLGYIFELCYDQLQTTEALSVEKADIRTRQRQPFRLAAVCRRWRAASLANPRSWAYLELSFDHVKSGHPPAFVAYVQTVVSRARAVPLDVCLTRKRESKSHHKQLAVAVADALCNCVTIQLRLHNICSGDTLLPILTAHTPMLVEARVDLPSVSATVLAETRVFPGAISLRKFYAKDVFHPGSSLEYPALKDARLQNLVSESVDDEKDVLKKLFHSSPSLVKLWLDFPTFNYRSSSSSPQLAVPQLTWLIMDVEDDCVITRLLSRYNFPALSSLTLYGNPASSNARLSALRSFMETSPVTKFTISDIDRVLRAPPRHPGATHDTRVLAGGVAQGHPS